MIVRISLACVLSNATAWGEDFDKSNSLPGPKFQLTLTEIELEAAITRYQESIGLTQQISLEEVTVKASAISLKMRDSTQDVPGGIAAPFWALLHPTQAWRILLPIPPKQPAPGTPDEEQ